MDTYNQAVEKVKMALRTRRNPTVAVVKRLKTPVGFVLFDLLAPGDCECFLAARLDRLIRHQGGGGCFCAPNLQPETQAKIDSG